MLKAVSPWMRRPVLAALALAGVPVVASVLLLFASALMDRERPAILEGLPHEAVERTSAFTERLITEFPVGTDEMTLKSQLMDWGFQLDEDDVGQYAHFRTDPIVCQDTYFVYWTLDAERQLSHIEGDVHIGCP